MFRRRKRKEDPLFAIELGFKCPQKWKEMEGDEQVRHCSACKKNVYNLSSMTREEAVAFINKSEGKECVTFYQRTDGKVITKDCLPDLGIKNLRLRPNPLTVLNAGLACSAVALAPMLGPALVTIQTGGMARIVDLESDTDTNYNIEKQSEVTQFATPEEMGLELDLVDEEGKLKD